MRAAPAMRLNLGDLTLPLLISRNPRAVFWTFVLCHGVVWTLTPALSQPNGPVDVIELFNWARHPQWGYWKHPPLPAWVVGVLAPLGDKRLWGTYLVSQIAVGACFWAVWRFARDFLEPPHALVSVLLLEGVYYYNFRSIEFNHNMLLLPFWSWTPVLLWHALRSGRICYWLLCGVMAGLGLLTKYAMFLLVIPLAFFMLLNGQARKSLAKPGPYVALAVAGVIFMPHVVWVFSNDFTTIHYVLDRAKGQGQLIDHLLNPLTFSFYQAAALVPVMIMVGLLLFGSMPNREHVAVAGFPRAFLFTVALGPFLAFLAISATMGLELRARWGAPLWSFIGVFVLYHLPPVLTPKALCRFTCTFLSVAAICVALFIGQFAVIPRFIGRPLRGQFPGQAIADYVTAQWVRHLGARLPIVAGDKWFAANIGFYSPHRPDVYTDLDPRKSRWTSDNDFKERGGVIIWDAGNAGEALPDGWRVRFPNALVQPVASIAWQTSARIAPVRIGWAFVAPAPLHSPR